MRGILHGSTTAGTAILVLLLVATGTATAGLVDVNPSGDASADLLAVGQNDATAGCVALPGGLCVPGIAVGETCATGGVAVGQQCAQGIFLSVSDGGGGSTADDVAVSVFWGASSRLLALSGTGDATCDSPTACLAASATGTATAGGGGQDVAISGCQVLTAAQLSDLCGHALVNEFGDAFDCVLNLDLLHLADCVPPPPSPSGTILP
jgi:hypothetical protein